MTEEIVAALRARGVHLWVEGDRLRYRAPKGVIDEDIRSRLRAAKAAIIERLSAEVWPPPRTEGPAPLSSAQLRIWTVEHLHESRGAYNICAVLRLRGDLDSPAMNRALLALTQRHDALHTRFIAEPGREPMQIPGKVQDIEIPLDRFPTQDTEDAFVLALAQARAEARRPFDLERDLLFRACWLQLAANDHLLLLTMHHIIADGVSLGVLVDELATGYAAEIRGRAAQVPDPELSYRDWAAWQRRWLASGAGETSLAFWRDVLTPLPAPLEMPADRPRPATQGFAGDLYRVELGAESAAALQALARDCGVSTFTLVLAAWAVLLSRYTARDDVTLGTAMANRDRPGLENMVGIFVNMLILRLDLSEDPSFLGALKRVRGTLLEALEHSEIPFEVLVDHFGGVSSRAAHPLFQIACVDAGPRPRAPSLPGLVSAWLDLPLEGAKFDLTLFFRSESAAIELEVEYRTDLFERATIASLMRCFRVLLRSITANPDTPIGSLNLITQDQITGIAAYGVQPESQDCIPDRWARVVSTRGDAVAVVEGTRRLTYAELAMRVDRLARALRARGVRPGCAVAVDVPRSIELVVAILGIVTAGGAYLALGDACPPERMKQMLADAGVRHMLRRDTGTTVAGVEELILGFEYTEDREPSHPPTPVPRDPAYLIYTSGSTGRPKGVRVSHANLLRLFDVTSPRFEPGAEDVWTLFHSAAFDFSVWELFGCLLFGGRLVIVPYSTSRSPESFLQLLQSERVTVLNQTPSAFRELVHATARRPDTRLSLRLVIFGGEALDPAMLTAWFERYGDHSPRLVNMYGITETTIHVTWQWLTRGDAAQGQSNIGVPLPDLRVHLLDGRLQRVPDGAVGVIVVAGPGVADGYPGNPAATAALFLPDPFSARPGARMYRSGDLGRRRRDGSIEFLGRLDQQVKIRGFRIELGEIESVLSSLEGVRDAVATATDGDNGKRIFAYVRLDDDAAPALDRLVTQAKRILPDYMIPAAIVPVSEFPLTRNGKLDVAALPKPGEVQTGERIFARAVTSTELKLTDVWRQVLELERISIDDSFFLLGGDSLRAISATSLARSLGLNLRVEDLYETPTIRLLAKTADHAPTNLPSAAVFSDRPPGIEALYPATALQTGMQYHMELEPDVPVYHCVLSYWIRSGLDFAALEEALGEIVARHSVLRTSLELDRDDPLQLVHEHVAVPANYCDLRTLSASDQEASLRAFLASEAHLRFQPDDPPLWRLTAHHRSEDSFQLTFTHHHALLDGWSVNLFFREIFELYRQRLETGRLLSVPPLRTSFADYVALEQATLQDQGARNFWSRELGGASVLVLPRWPVDADVAGHSMHEVPLPSGLVGELRSACATRGLPLKSLLLATHVRVLAYVAGEQDVVTGLTLGARPDTPDAEQVLGLFLNTLPLRIQIGHDTWAGLAQGAWRAEKRLFRHRHYPYAAVQRMFGGSELFTTTFNYTHFHVSDALIRHGPLELVRAHEVEQTHYQYGANFTIDMTSAELRLILEYDRALFAADQIERIGGYFQRALTAAARSLDGAVQSCELLDTREREQIGSYTHGAIEKRLRAQGLVHELVAEQALKSPGATALRFRGVTMTYEELQMQIGRVSRRLHDLGLRRGEAVGVCFPRGFSQIVSALAVMQAGGAYLPLDPEAPHQRQSTVVDDAGARILLTTPGLAVRFPDRILALPGEEAGLKGYACRELRPVDAAYLIYTSGTTGRPKGIKIPHGALVNRIAWGRRILSPTADDRLLHSTIATFDPSLTELVDSLANGACLVLPAQDALLDVERLARLIVAERVTMLAFCPARLSALLDAPASRECDAVRLILSGGEALTGDLRDRCLNRWPQARLINLYGVAEAAVDATWWDASQSADKVSIGRPLDNVIVQVLGPDLTQVPIGTPGELAVGGAGLGLGYVGLPRLTAERFVPSAQSEVAGERLYRTGDRGRFLPGGDLEYLGRFDRQIKLRGMRIEPEEIEDALLSHPQVTDAVVVAGSDSLVAYLVTPREIPDLRTFLYARLPRAWVPGAYVVLDSLPLTPSGKVDLQSLPAPCRQSSPAYVSPTSELEVLIAGIWSDVLGLPRVGLDDDFFELGGHSLAAARILTKVRASLHTELPLRVIFDHPKLGDFVRATVRSGSGDRHARPERIPASRYPASAEQSQMCRVQAALPDSPFANMPGGIRLRGTLGIQRLSAAFQALIARHESLRTRFLLTPDRVIQIVDRSAPVDIPVEDLSNRQDLTPLVLAVKAEVSRAFDLTRSPLMRVRLMQIGPDDHILVMTLHHAIADGASIGVLSRELAVLYAGESLPEPSLQLGDYTRWLDHWVESDAAVAQILYWRANLAQPLPPMRLGCDKSLPGEPSRDMRVLPLSVDTRLADRLRERGKVHRTTLFVVLAASISAVLHRCSGESDIRLGTLAANRGLGGTDGIVGLLANTIVIRNRVHPAMHLDKLIDDTREMVIQGLANSDVPFQKVIAALDVEPAALFDVMFLLQDSGEQPRMEGLDIEPFLPGSRVWDVGVVTTCALVFILFETPKGLVGQVKYDADRLDEDRARSMIGEFGEILDSLATSATAGIPVGRAAGGNDSRLPPVS